MALLQLSRLVRAQPPAEAQAQAQERTAVQGLVDALAVRLRGAVIGFNTSELTTTVTSLSRLRHYDGPLLRTIAALAVESVAHMQLHHAAGMLWAYGRCVRAPLWAVGRATGGSMHGRMVVARPTAEAI